MLSDRQNTTQIPEIAFLSPLAACFIDSKEAGGIPKLFEKIEMMSESLKNIMTAPLNLDEGIGSKIRTSADIFFEIPLIVGLILTNELYVGDVINSIEKRLSIDSSSARDLANLIISQTLQPAIQDIKALQQKKFADRLKNPNVSAPGAVPPQKQGIDPIIASQRISGTVNLRQSQPTTPPKQIPPQNTPTRPTQGPAVYQGPTTAPKQASPSQGINQPPPELRQFKMPPPLPSEPTVNADDGKTLNLRELDR